MVDKFLHLKDLSPYKIYLDKYSELICKLTFESDDDKVDKDKGRESDLFESCGT